MYRSEVGHQAISLVGLKNQCFEVLVFFGRLQQVRALIKQ